MTLCEMCGKTGDLVSVAIEGVPLTVCGTCAKYGTVNRHHPVTISTTFANGRKVSSDSPKYHPQPSAKPEYRVIDSYASLIRNVREKRGMTQKEFALLLQEKESFVGKWESAALKPDLETAKKLQKILGVTLIALDEDAVPAEKIEKNKSTEFTLGDFIKVRPAKKI